MMDGMMEYRRQTPKNCLAYALLQVGAVSEEAVREYERDNLEGIYENTAPWIAKHLSEKLVEDIFPGSKSGLWRHLRRALTGSFKLDGKGIITLRGKFRDAGHAISFENGLVLDPGQDEKRMTLEEYLTKHSWYEIIDIIRTDGGEND